MKNTPIPLRRGEHTFTHTHTHTRAHKHTQIQKLLDLTKSGKSDNKIDNSQVNMQNGT